MNVNTRIACIYLEQAIERNQLKDFLTGTDFCELMTVSREGENFFNPKSVMDALYEKYKQKEEQEKNKFVKEIYENFTDILKNEDDLTMLIRCLKDLEFHMRQEIKGIAPFSLNIKELLNVASNNNKIKSNLNKKVDLKEDYYYKLLKEYTEGDER